MNIITALISRALALLFRLVYYPLLWLSLALHKLKGKS